MDNQNQNTNVIFPTGDPGTTGGSAGYGQTLSQPQSLDPVAVAPIQPIAVAQQQKEQRLLVRLVKRADVILAILLVLGSAGLVLNAYVGDKPAVKSVTGEYDTTQIPLDGFATSEGIDFGTQSVIINGYLQANEGLIIAPTLQPTSAVAGQMYYDQTTNVLAYYNGTQFVPVSGASGVQSVAGLTGNITVGAGLSSAGGQLSNNGVLTVQGQTGNVNFTAGNGISIAGTTISNSGIVSVSSSSPSLTVTNDGNGNITLGGAGAGTVTSSGGTAGVIPLFTASQNIEDSIVTQSGLTVTVSGDLAVVTGGLTLSNALTVSNGGTGVASLALNGVLVGQGTGAITSVVAGGAGLCLLSTAGTPSWSACPGGSGVDSLNGLTGALSIANASAAGSTITIDDASTVTKGIASFNATNFTAAGGAINTVQNINTGATPTFAGVNTNSITPSAALTVGATGQSFTLQGSNTSTITATNGVNTTTVGFVTPGANVSINFPALAAGTYDLCTTSGNCLGGGGGGANTALSNLTSVAINTTLLPGVAGGVHLGSGTLPFGDLFLAGTSGTPGTNNFRITGASTGGTRTITLPDDSGTVCLTTGNCAGTGGGVTVSSPGTAGTLPVFTGTQTIADSLVSQSGGTVTANGNLNLTVGNQFQISGTQISSANLSNDANLAKLNASQTFTGGTNAFQNSINSTNAFNVQNASGTRILTVDTSNGEIELGVGSALNGTLVFHNVSNANTVTIVPGTPTASRTITLPDDSGIVCLNTGNCAGAGATLQTAYNFSVGGTTPKVKVNSTLGGVDIQDADTTIAANLFNIRASNSLGLGSVMFGVHSAGAVTLQNSANSTTALNLLTAGGTSVLTGDTTNGQIILGQSSTLNGTLVFNNATNTNQITVTTAAATAPQTITLPNATGTVCLTSGNCDGAGSTSTLQAAYDAGNTILTSTARDIRFDLADSATDANFLVDLQCDTTCSTNGRFAIQDDGVDVFSVSPVGGAALFRNFVNSTTALQVQDAAGTTTVLNVDTTNGRVGVMTAAPQAKLHVSSSAAEALFRVTDATVTAVDVLNIADEGATTFRNRTNSAAAFQVQDTASAGLLTVDTSTRGVGGGNLVKIGNSTGTDTATTILQLDGTTADPTSNLAALNGGMFYNSTTHKVSLIENGQVKIICNTTDLGCGTGTVTLQAAYINSTGGTTSEIIVDATRGALDVQDRSTTNGGTIGANLLNVRATAANDATAGATLLSVGNTGAFLSQNSTNSANAFRILNAAGTGEHVGVDTTDSILRLLANNTGHLSGTGTNWNTGTALPAARGSGAAVTVNGYLYHLGGCDAGSGATTTVYYARLNSDGSVGSWATTTALPQALCGNSATTYNGYIYVHGGGSSAAISQDVFYAKPNTDGTITAWTTQDNPTNLLDHNNAGMAAHNGYLYIAGGNQNDTTGLRHVFYGRINADGSVPSFTQQTDWLPAGDHNPGQVAIANGTLYVMGSSNYDKFFYGRINANGSVAAQTQATGTTASRKYAAISVLNGYMYAIAGGTNGLSSVQYGAFANSGDIGAFTTDTTTLPALRSVCAHTAPTANSYMYLVGCGDGNFTAQATVYYASGTRVKVGGGLDLVGYSGEGASDGGTGGQLSAGNTNINGTLSVTGNTNLKDGAVIGNNLNVSGLTSLQTTTNSTTGFQVLNASAAPQFVVDTTNSRVYIGNPTADSTGALLVLDTKNTSGDPTGVLGSMYYNTNIDKFRCFEYDYDTAGFWRDCMVSARTGLHYSNDMWSTTGDSKIKFDNDGSSGGFDPDALPAAGHPGIITAGTGGTSSGRFWVGSPSVGSEELILGNGDYWRYETVMRIPTGSALSDDTNDYVLLMGFHDDLTTDGTDGCFLKYNDNVNTGRWQGQCRAGGVSSTCDTTVTVATDTWYRLTVAVNSAGTSADFQVTTGGTTSRCQVTTNIPTGSSQYTGWSNTMDKNLGTTDRWIHIDYIELLAQFGTAR